MISSNKQQSTNKLKDKQKMNNLINFFKKC